MLVHTTCHINAVEMEAVASLGTRRSITVGDHLRRRRSDQRREGEPEEEEGNRGGQEFEYFTVRV
jgi:hypothetical protein